MLKELPPHLVLRNAKHSDIKPVLELVHSVLGKDVAPAMKHIMRNYPGFSIKDIFLIFDNEKNKVVSTLCLLKTRCMLNGFEIPFAHMELVATDPEYRNRGLIRHLNEAFEEQVNNLQLPVILVAGIPYYYRIFGYEYAIPLGTNIPIALEYIPKLKKDEKESVYFEKVTAKSCSSYLRCRGKRNAYLDLYRHLNKDDVRYILSTKLGEAMAANIYLVRSGRQLVGSFLITHDFGILGVRELWLKDSRFIYPVLRFAARISRVKKAPLQVELPSNPSMEPVLEALAGVRFRPPYAWYVRIPSIKHYLETIKPVLEQRIAGSEFHGLNEKLRLSLYKTGYELVFRHGKLNQIKQTNRINIREMDMALPPLVVNQLLLGYRSLGELKQIYPDAISKIVKIPLIDTLFPKLRANLTPVI